MIRKIAICLLGTLLLVTEAQASQVLHDPTRPPGKDNSTKPQSQHKLTLQSVLVSAQRKVAIINGRRYQEGDRIGAGRVSGIHRRGVSIAMPEKTISLRLRQVIVKRRAEADL